MMQGVCILALIAFSFGSEVAKAEDDPKDINGYDKAVWGMTEDEVMKAEAPKIAKLKKREIFAGGKTASLGIDEVLIGDITFKGLFLFDDTSHKLVQVNLDYHDETNLGARRAFSATAKLLTDKFGPPSTQDTDETMPECTWELAKTKISCLAFLEPIKLKSVVISYSAKTEGTIASGSLAQGGDTDFRKAKWGMSVAQVKATESGKPDEIQKGQKKLLVFQDDVSGVPCKVAYIFVNDKLVRAKYRDIADHVNKNAYLSDFEHLYSALRKKYGESEEKTIWVDNLYRNDPDEWGMAVSTGHLLKYASWETTTTTITIGLSGDHFEIDLQIEYKSKELSSLEEHASEDEERQKL
jgi:hypothetical protein